VDVTLERDLNGLVLEPQVMVLKCPVLVLLELGTFSFGLGHVSWGLALAPDTWGLGVGERSCLHH